ncbi:potassium channel family protein [Tamlana agarivorans]|uniref:Potassium channel family protein n=1 Tax=Pseudotamlana agarivorans TaxID=481183 RepID=A0ACC5UC13_9FLAO|nr:ion channel [Tamlana agarivorans]MBU2951857.1 potassium channel family protein [Tamlana agarivorans]
MIYSLLIGSIIIIISVVVQAIGNVYWLKKIKKKNKHYTSKFALTLLVSSFLFFSFLHFIQSLLWALTYMLIPEINNVFAGFTEAWYFSMITFTSLGYGDLTLPPTWHLISGIEAINGIMLIGWSTAMMYSLIQQIFKNLYSN